MSEPVLFLDVDGVLNSAEFFVNGKPKPTSATTVDPRAVRRIQRVVDRTGAKVVLSSTWRHHPELVSYLRDQSVPIDDVTPRSTTGHRGSEIWAWLRAHPEVSVYAVIDDDPDAAHFGTEANGQPFRTPHFVRTYWRVGMYGKHEKALVEHLTVASSQARAPSTGDERK